MGFKRIMELAQTMPFYYNKGQKITAREPQNGNRIRLNLAILLNTPLGRKRCMILYITLSSFYYLAHESRTLALIDYIDNSFLRAERGHLSSRLSSHRSVTVCSESALCSIGFSCTDFIFLSWFFFTNEGKQAKEHFKSLIFQASFIGFRLHFVSTPFHFGGE